MRATIACMKQLEHVLKRELIGNKIAEKIMRIQEMLKK